MDSYRARQVTGPGGSLVERVGDHVASADRLVQQSKQAIGRVRARVRRTHHRVDETSQRVQALADAAGVAYRITAGTADRVRKVKQRELAAHLAAVELHEQAAALQERLGHPERAAVARGQAEQARQWHRLAEQEMTDYEARIAAANAKTGKMRRRSS